MPVANTVSKIDIFNINERKNEFIYDAIINPNNNVIITLERERLERERLERERLERLNNELNQAVNNLRNSTNTLNVNIVMNACLSLVDILHNNRLLTMTQDNIELIASYRNAEFSFVSSDNGTFRLSIYDHNNEVYRLDGSYIGYITTFPSVDNNELLNKTVILKDGRIKQCLISKYKDIPGAPGYRINRLAPFDIIGGEVKISDKRKLKYIVYKLGNRQYYEHVLFAWAAELLNYDMLKIDKTRDEYCKMLNSGTLYVIDHLDNNPNNNDIINLRIITQQQNNSRKGKVKIVKENSN